MAYPLSFLRTVTAGTSGVDVTFGFGAETLWLRNDDARSVYLNLASSAAASSSGGTYLELKSSESLGPFDCFPLAAFNAYSTTTTIFRVVARGW
jgi:hypothetical protein